MGISVIISGEKPLPRSITLVATRYLLWKVGLMRVNLIKSNYISFIESYAPGTGVAKELMFKLEEVFQKLARSGNCSFGHKITFQTEEARKRLEHYLEEYGLPLGYTKQGKVWYKLYKP